MIIQQKKNEVFEFQSKNFVILFYSSIHPPISESDTSASVIVTVPAADAFATTMDTIHLRLNPAEASIFYRNQLHYNKILNGSRFLVQYCSWPKKHGRGTIQKHSTENWRGHVMFCSHSNFHAYTSGCIVDLLHYHQATLPSRNGCGMMHWYPPELQLQSCTNSTIVSLSLHLYCSLRTTHTVTQSSTTQQYLQRNNI